MFDAFELHADRETRKRLWAAATAATVTLAALVGGAALLAARPSLVVEREKKVDVSFRPPPPPPEPAKIEQPPPPPKVKPPPAPKPPVVAEVVAAPVPASAPAAAPMVAPKEVPKVHAPESETAVPEQHIAVGGSGDGTGQGGDGVDESPAPVAAMVGHSGPVNLPEDADPPEPDEANAQPEYPEVARSSGQEAKVVLKIVIERDGRVGKIQVLKGEEPFLTAALSVVRAWRYEPARLESEPIAVFKIVNLTFQLRE